jgi:hypothetical protein
MARWSGAAIKVVGKSGQISLGKSYAGKTLRLQHREDGSILVTPVAVVPESQSWTIEEPDRSRIAMEERAIQEDARRLPARRLEHEFRAILSPRLGRPVDERAFRLVGAEVDHHVLAMEVNPPGASTTETCRDDVNTYSRSGEKRELRVVADGRDDEGPVELSNEALAGAFGDEEAPVGRRRLRANEGS